MNFENVTGLELSEFALDTRLSESDRASIIIELVERAKKVAYDAGYRDGVADVKEGWC